MWINLFNAIENTKEEHGGGDFRWNKEFKTRALTVNELWVPR